MDLTVIIPAYNSERYITKLLNSVFKQTLKDFEIIVIENGSTDNTFELSKELLNSSGMAHKIIHLDSANTGMARNYGMKYAEGKYLFFIDSDDFLVDDSILEECTQLLDRNEDLSMVYFGFNRTNQRGNIVEKYSNLYKYYSNLSGLEFLKKFLIGKTWIHIGNFVIRRSILEIYKILFPVNFKHGEDQVFIIKALLVSKKVTAVQKVGMHYVRNTNSLSLNPSEDSIRVFLELVDSLKNKSVKSIYPEESIRNLLSILWHHKIPYLIISEALKGCVKDPSFSLKILDKYANILKNSRLVLTRYGIATYFLSRIFIHQPNFFCKLAKFIIRKYYGGKV